MSVTYTVMPPLPLLLPLLLLLLLLT